MSNRCVDAYRDIMLKKLDKAKPLLRIFMQSRDFTKFSAELLIPTNITMPIVISTIVPDGQVTCEYAHKPVIPNFMVASATEFRLSCLKQSSETIQFGVDTTDRGMTPMVTVPAAPDRLTDLSEQVALLAAGATRMNEQLAAVQNATVPSGTTAYFRFQACPPGWTPEELLRGRYVVGVNANNLADVRARVGVPLANMENRATGKHTHRYVDRVPGGPSHVLQSGNSYGRPDINRTTGFAGSIDGTNAPYVQLLACRKQ